MSLPTLLLSIQVLLSSGSPAKGAEIACWEVRAGNVENGTSDEGGWWVPTDSRGVMYFEFAPQSFHCTVYRKDLKQWSGVLTFTPDHRREVVTMEAQ